jgi:hypothetical protein
VSKGPRKAPVENCETENSMGANKKQTLFEVRPAEYEPASAFIGVKAAGTFATKQLFEQLESA